MSKLNPEVLLAQAVSDAASLAVSLTTSSDGTTVYGIGATSGRAILAVGQLALRGIENAYILIRLISIRNQLRQRGDISYGLVDDLLEFQRINLYSDTVRRWAWSMIGVLLKRQQVEHFTQVLATWPPLETQLFLRQLVAYRFVDVINRDQEESIRRFFAVTQSVRTIVLSLLDKDPLFLQGIFDASDFATFLIPGLHHGHSVNFSLSSFFEHLCVNYKDEEKRTRIIEDMGRYLCAEGPEQIKPVVDHILEALRYMTADYQFQDRKARIRHRISGAMPYLSFAHHLASVSPVACQLFVERRTWDTVERFCVYGFPNVSCDHYQTTVKSSVHIRWLAWLTCCQLLVHLYPEHGWSWIELDPEYVAVILDTFKNMNPCKDIIPFGQLPGAAYSSYAQTWNTVLHAMVSDRGTRIAEIVSQNLTKDIKVRFLRDLSGYKNCGWFRNAGVFSSITDYYASSRVLLDHALHNLLYDLATNDPTLLLEAYGLSGFTRILMSSDYLVRRQGRNNSSSALSSFIGYVVFLCHRAEDDWGLPGPLIPLVELLKYTDATVVRPLLERVMDALWFFTCSQYYPEDLAQLADEFDYLPPNAVVHPIHPFLLLVYHLSMSNSDIAHALCEDGLIDVLEKLWLTKCSQMFGDSSYRAQYKAWRRMCAGILLILSVLLHTTGCSDRVLRSDLLPRLLPEDIHVNAIRQHSSDEGIQVLILRSVEYSLLSAKDACPDLWTIILSLPLRRNQAACRDQETNISALDGEVARLLICITALPEHRWRNVLEGMRYNTEEELRYALTAVIEYIRRLSESTQSRQLLTRKLDEMHTFGFLSWSESMNPVESFITLLAAAKSDKRITVLTLLAIGLPSLLDDFYNGTFNILQRGGPHTDSQRDGITSICQTLRYDMNIALKLTNKDRTTRETRLLI